LRYISLSYGAVSITKHSGIANLPMSHALSLALLKDQDS
jgi:hypothetical protein